MAPLYMGPPGRIWSRIRNTTTTPHSQIKFNGALSPKFLSWFQGSRWKQFILQSWLKTLDLRVHVGLMLGFGRENLEKTWIAQHSKLVPVKTCDIIFRWDVNIHLPASFPSLIWNPGWQMFDSSVATARFFTHDAAKCAKCQIRVNYCPKSTWVPGASNYQGLRFQKVYPVACSHRGSGSWTILNDIVNVYIYIIIYIHYMILRS